MYRIAMFLIVLSYCAAISNAQTATFNYQGRLTDATLSASGTYQMQFTVYDALSGGAVVGSTITNSSVTVTGGIFTVSLDYSPQTPFVTGADRWIEIAVKKPADPGYTTLTPRQKMTSSPYATKSLSADNADSLGGLAANTYLQTNGNGSGLTNLNGANITNNTISAAALAADTFPNNQNRSRLGQMRWDLLVQRVTVGSLPRGAAFDGANIWVANSNNNNVTKLRASDGATLGTFAVGTSPYSIVFDGTNIWVANLSSNGVTKLRASDGVVLNQFGMSAPAALAFDGVNIWAVSSNANQVVRRRASDLADMGFFAVGANPSAIVFDGVNIWVPNNGNNNVTKLRASDGSLLGTFPVGSGPQGIAYDGGSIWVTNNSSANVTKLRASDGALLGTYAVGTGPLGIAFDGSNIWVANVGSNTVSKLRPTDGALLETLPVGLAPQRMAYDGASMWVTSRDDNTVTKLPVFP